MSSGNEHVRAQAQARLERQTPIANDARLLPLQEEVAAIVREAKRRDPSGANQLVSTGIDKVAASVSEVTHLRRLPDVLRALDIIITAPPSAVIGD